MAYNNNIPQPTDQLSVSQADLLNNFASLGTLLDPNNGGVKFVVQGAAPAATATLQMYSINNALTKPALYIERETGSTDVPLIVDFTSATKTATGQCILPSGIMLKWGTATANNSAQNFATAFPTGCLNVQITGNYPGGEQHFINLTAKTAASFTANSYSRNGNADSAAITYFAIGY